jgi:agmatine deiminase
MRRIPAEWEAQQCVLMAFPHKNTDWHESDNPQSLDNALRVFVRIAQAIAYSQAVYIICDDKIKTASLFCATDNMTFIEIPSNDTWIRDYGYISLKDKEDTQLLDFKFDAWGGKFDAVLDNNINILLHKKGYMGTTPLKSIDFVLEGGSIESDGQGTILTTTSCLCNPNRNAVYTQAEIEEKLFLYLGAKRILWLDDGYLAGDDTDGHIDTLARFVSLDSIAYLQCQDKSDEHYEALFKMQETLKRFKTKENKPYTLIPLPMTKAIYNAQGQRLPATYLNFLITNKALMYPTYGDILDQQVHRIFKHLFPTREIIPVECLKLIEQGGSLHCSTMQVARS